MNVLNWVENYCIPSSKLFNSRHILIQIIVTVARLLGLFSIFTLRHKQGHEKHVTINACNGDYVTEIMFSFSNHIYLQNFKLLLIVISTFGINFMWLTVFVTSLKSMLISKKWRTAQSVYSDKIFSDKEKEMF